MNCENISLQRGWSWEKCALSSRPAPKSTATCKPHTRGFKPSTMTCSLRHSADTFKKSRRRGQQSWGQLGTRRKLLRKSNKLSAAAATSLERKLLPTLKSRSNSRLQSGVLLKTMKRAVTGVLSRAKSAGRSPKQSRCQFVCRQTALRS